MNSYSVSVGIPNEPKSGNSIFFVPPGWGGAGNVSVYISGISGQGYDPAVPSLCALPNDVGGQSQNSFQFSWTIQGGNTVALVVVAYSAVSLGDPASRKALLNNFKLFKQQLVALEGTKGQGGNCLISGGADIIANRVALSIPLQLTETLSYYYNFSVEHRYIDLVPGMRLRVEPAAYSAPAPSGRAGSQADGYVTSGTYFLDVNISKNNELVFNSWAGAIAPSSVANVTANENSFRILGLIDLSAQGMARRFWRLVWPTQFGGVPSDIHKDPTLSQNVAFIGADTSAELETATTTFLNTGKPPKSTGKKGQALCAFFSGRASVIPEISVVVNGQQHWVAAGTTVRQMAERSGMPSLKQMAGPKTPRADAFQVSLKRWSQTGNSENYVLVPVVFQNTIEATFDENGDTQWDLPLMFGDQLSFFGEG